MQELQPLYVPIPRALELSGCCRTRLYEALRRGDLAAKKAGRRTLISVESLQAYLAALPAYQAGA